MEQVNLIKDSAGNTAYVVLPYQFFSQYLPENFTYKDLEEFLEDLVMNKAMDEAKKTDLLTLDEAAKHLEEL